MPSAGKQRSGWDDHSSVSPVGGHPSKHQVRDYAFGLERSAFAGMTFEGYATRRPHAFPSTVMPAQAGIRPSIRFVTVRRDDDPDPSLFEDASIRAGKMPSPRE